MWGGERWRHKRTGGGVCLKGSVGSGGGRASEGSDMIAGQCVPGIGLRRLQAQNERIGLAGSQD